MNRSTCFPCSLSGLDSRSRLQSHGSDESRAPVTRDGRRPGARGAEGQIIATAICGGLDLGRNLKRGVGPHSIDAVAWRHEDGWVDVVDIAYSYDDTGRELQLHWIVVDGPSGWDPVPAPDCE